MDSNGVICLLVFAAPLTLWYIWKESVIANERSLAWSAMADHLGLSFKSHRGTLTLSGTYRGRPLECTFIPGSGYSSNEVAIGYSLQVPDTYELSLSYRKLFAYRGLPTDDPDLERKMVIDFEPDDLGTRFFAYPGIRADLLAFGGPIEVSLKHRQLSSSQLDSETESEIVRYLGLLVDIADALEAVEKEG